jgi:hypothetical protein
VKLSAHPSILLNSRECSPLGVNKGVNIPPRGQSSPLGAKFIPRGWLHPWGQTMLLKTGLRAFTSFCFLHCCCWRKVELNKFYHLWILLLWASLDNYSAEHSDWLRMPPISTYNEQNKSPIFRRNRQLCTRGPTRVCTWVCMYTCRQNKVHLLRMHTYVCIVRDKSDLKKR